MSASPKYNDWSTTMSRQIRDDWKDFVKGFLPKKFDRYDWNDTRDGPGWASTKVVEAVEKGDPAIFIDSVTESFLDTSDGEYQAYQECLKEFAKEWENPAEVRNEMENYTYFQDDFYKIYEEREQDNWWTLINGLNLLVWNTSNSWSLGWVEQEQDVKTELEESPALREFYELSGLTEKQFAELVANGYDYDTQGFIGEIVDAGDLLLNMLGEMYQQKRTPEKIVAFHNGLVGNGYFLPAPNAKVGLDPSKKMAVDFGSYSLGDVYGTNEWTWR